jgi:hypothetical protein
MAGRATLLAGLAALLAGGLALAGLAAQLPDFWDPCLQWGQTSGSSVSLPGPPPCERAMRGTSETREGMALRLLLVQGGILSGVGLGLAGAAKERAALMPAGALILLAESVPLMFGGTFVLTLGAALLLLAAWRAVAREARPASKPL